jgi:starch-binding outer membrane protein, SusD/RagB family
MKKIFGYIILIALVSLAGCKKLVEEKPLSDGTLDQFFRTSFDAEAAMAGMYGAFQQTMIGESQFNNRITFWGDARSDNMERQKQYSNNSTSEVHFNSLSPNNNFADWGPLYTVIGRANLNIEKFPDINKYSTNPNSKDYLPDATLKSYLAQCYAMRAICYFYILRVWGDAPIRTTAFLDLNDNSQAPREPKTKVKDQILSDLQTAYDMTVKAATPSVWHIGEGAIAAIMADVYMWRSHDGQIVPDYVKAIEWVKNVFKAKAPTGKTYTGTATAGTGGLSPDLETTANWKNIFINPAGSIETIWTIHWDVTANGCPCMSGVSSAVNNTPMRTDVNVFNTWAKSTTDVRGKQTIDATKTDNWDRLLKWYGPSGFTDATKAYLTSTQSAAVVGTDKPVYFPVYRLADIFLLYAEALNKTGDKATAIKYLNFVHQRATLPAYTLTGLNNNETTIEDAILDERRWELFAEGKRWFDLVRTDRVIQVMNPILIARQTAEGAAANGWGNDKRRYVWPLHRNVLNANPNLVQNPPYSD